MKSLVGGINGSLVDSALIWMGLLMFICLVLLGGSFWFSMNEDKKFYLPSPFVPLAIAGVLELGMANGYLPENQVLNIISLVLISLAVVLTILGRRFDDRFWPH